MDEENRRRAGGETVRTRRSWRNQDQLWKYLAGPIPSKPKRKRGNGKTLRNKEVRRIMFDQLSRTDRSDGPASSS